MSEGDYAVQHVENDCGVDQFVVVQLAKVLHVCYSPLVKLEIVLFQAEGDLFKYIIDDTDNEVLVIAIKSTS